MILTLISIASTEPPVFGQQFNPIGSFQTSQKFGPQNGFDYNDWIIRPPNNLYGPPGSGHNHNNNGNNNPNGYPQYPFFPTQRPHTPHDSYGVPVIHNPNNGGYNYKPASSFFRVGGFKGERSDLPTFEKPLFSPSSGLEFAATNGQIDNFNKALQEEAQQQLQQLQGQGQEQTQTAFANGFTGYSNLEGSQQPAKSYVSVKFGQPSRHYNYQF